MILFEICVIKCEPGHDWAATSKHQVALKCYELVYHDTGMGRVTRDRQNIFTKFNRNFPIQKIVKSFLSSAVLTLLF